jgi:hypothetical protein
VNYSIRNIKKMKKNNYYRLVNGRPTEGKTEGWRNNEWLVESGFFLLDYDVKPGNGGWKKVWEEMKGYFKEWGVVHFEKSISGGAHLTVVRTEGLTIEENIQLFELRTGLEFDHSCKDLARACFLVPNEYVLYEDPLYYEDGKPEPLPLSEEDRKRMDEWKEQQMEIHRQQVGQRRVNAQPVPHGEEDEKLLEWLVEQICEKQVDLTSNYDHWIYIGFVIANIKGWAGEELYQRVSSFYPGYDPKEVNEKYRILLRDSRGEVGIGTLIMFAQGEGVVL